MIVWSDHVPVRMRNRPVLMSAVAKPSGGHEPASGARLASLCVDVADAVTGPLLQRDRRVAAALAPYLGLPDLLDGSVCECSPDRYVRHLLHAAADYTVLALVWRPGQMSPVHGHRTWCALGLHHGHLIETFFTPEAVPAGCVLRGAGDVSHGSADEETLHRLANLGTQTAISIHVYGAAYDRLGDSVNRIWEDPGLIASA